MSDKQVLRLIWNFLSLPLLLAGVLLVAFLFGSLLDANTNPRYTDTGVADFGGAFLILGLATFLAVIVVILWHIWVIREILKFFKEKRVRNFNIAILLFPYAVAACIFLSKYFNEIDFDKKARAQITDKDYTIKQLASGSEEIIATQVCGDSMIVVCGEVVEYAKSADSLVQIARRPVKLLPEKKPIFLRNAAKKSTLKYYVFKGDSLKKLQYKPDIFYQGKDSSIWLLPQMKEECLVALDSFEIKGMRVFNKCERKFADMMYVRGFCEDRGLAHSPGILHYIDDRGYFYSYVRPVFYKEWHNFNDLSKEQQSMMTDYIYVAKMEKKDAVVYRMKQPEKNSDPNLKADFGLNYGASLVGINGKLYIIGRQKIITINI